MNIKKGLFIHVLMLFCLLFSYQTSAEENKGAITPRRGDGNIDIDISPYQKNDNILSGNSAIFALTLKVTGNDKIYNNVQIVIDLPSKDIATLKTPLNLLTINDVEPILDENNNQLIYNISKIETGFEQIIIYEFPTENGMNNESEITVSSELTADELDINVTPTKTTATVRVLSSLDYIFTKEIKAITDKDGNTLTRAPIQGDIVEWIIDISIVSKKYGQEFLDPNKKVQIKDTLPLGLSFFNASDNGVYNSKGSTIVWDVPVKSIELQKQDEFILNKSVTLKTKFDKKIGKVTKYTNKADISMITKSGNVISANDSAVVEQGLPSDYYPTIPPAGKIYVPRHYGPANGVNIFDPSQYNPNPTVGPDSLLMFLIQEVPHKATSLDKPFKMFETSYKIDSKLNLEYVMLRQGVFYSPYVDYPQIMLYGDSAQNATIEDIYGVINGVEKKLVTDAQKGSIYYYDSWENYNDRGSEITEIRVKNRYREAGISNYVQLGFSPKAGVKGKATNIMGYKYEGYDFSGELVSGNMPFTSAEAKDSKNIFGERYVTISTTNPTNPKPIVYNNINIINHNKGIIEKGSNRIGGLIKLDDTSKSLISPLYSSYIILPYGVTFDQINPEVNITTTNPTGNKNGKIELVNSDFKGTGREVLEIEWGLDQGLQVGMELSFEFNINVGENTLTTVIPELYSYIGTKEYAGCVKNYV